ncbi:MAG: hypothetical protein GX102_12970 [Porphyromonadaceae bacterium]|nr:hypothetical protein [Porphyromonadaceae bacterium]
MISKTETDINQNKKAKTKHTLHIISVLIIILSVVATSIGLFYSDAGEAHIFVNQYGDSVKIFGNGLYKHDSFFMAPIFKGTDFTILFIGVPLLIISSLLDYKRDITRTKLFLTSILSIFTYYSTSIAFGITYNALHLVYIALFGLSFFGLIIGIGQIRLKNNITIPQKGIKIFLIVSGISLFVAWLPDIIGSLANGRPLELIEVYTTQITYVLDMGIISPLCFICLYLLSIKSNLGYILLGIILTICIFVGFMVPIQTLFQMHFGIALPIQALITKVCIFILLAMVAIYYEIKLFKAL